MKHNLPEKPAPFLIKKPPQLTLQHFPKNGLRYSGKDGDENETLYKKDLTKILNLFKVRGPKGLETDVTDFEDLLSLDLNGIGSLVSTNRYLFEKIIKPYPAEFSKKIVLLLMEIENVKSPQEMSDVIKAATSKNPEITDLLSGFFQKNSSKIREPLQESITPFVFVQNAFQAELTILAKQLGVLENKLKNVEGQNVSFLSRKNSDRNKTKVMDAISGKVEVVETAYKNKLKHPIAAASKQFRTIAGSSGMMSIALKNPATRPFPPSIPINEVVSEEQYDAILAMTEAIDKGNGQAKIRIRTGGGKTHALDLMRQSQLTQSIATQDPTSLPLSPMRGSVAMTSTTPATALLSPMSRTPRRKGMSNISQRRTIDLNLNSTEEDLNEILNLPKPNNAIIQVDEAFFYGALFLDGRLKDQSSSVAGTNSDNQSPTEKLRNIEKLRNNFLSDLREKGSATFIVGASESLTKIQYECDRIERKIRTEENKLSLRENRVAISKANTFLYSLNAAEKREPHPVFLTILPEDSGTKTGSFWTQQARTPMMEDGYPVKLRRSKNEASNTASNDKKIKDEISNKEFLIRTAWYLKELCQFTLFENNDALECVNNLYRALTPFDTGKRGKTWPKLDGEKDKLKELNGLLQAAGVLTNARFKEFSLNTGAIHKAVSDFFDNELHLELPQDSKQQLDSSNTRLGKLSEKLKVKKSQLADLEVRRDEITLQRLKDSKLYLTDPQDSTSSSEPSLLTTVKGFLPKMELGQKMQYILPDFRINEQSCTSNDLHQILRDSKANLAILPDESETVTLPNGFNGKELRFRLGLLKGDKFTYLPQQPASEINRTLLLNQNFAVLSFFDQTNSIGGDYGNASLNISKQYIHLTRDDCLKDYQALDRNYLMQYDRNRTDPDQLLPMDLKLILPKAALNQALIPTNSTVNNVMPQALLDLIDRNTQTSDQFHLEGYLDSKEEKKRKDQEYLTTLETQNSARFYETANNANNMSVMLTSTTEEDSKETAEEAAQAAEEEEEMLRQEEEDTAAALSDDDEIYYVEDAREEEKEMEDDESTSQLGDTELKEFGKTLDEEELQEEDVNLAFEVLSQAVNNQSSDINADAGERNETLKPSSSARSSNIHKLAIPFQNPNKYQRYHGFMVLKEAYNHEDEAHKNDADIANTITRAIVQSALTCEKPLNIVEVVRALEISRQSGSLSQAFSTNNSMLTEEDFSNRTKYEKFSAHFQRTCATCGIYSPNNTETDPANLKGMRTSSVPEASVNDLLGLYAKLTKKGTVENGLRKYEPDSTKKLNEKNLEVAKILEKERNLNQVAGGAHR